VDKGDQKLAPNLPELYMPEWTRENFIKLSILRFAFKPPPTAMQIQHIPSAPMSTGFPNQYGAIPVIAPPTAASMSPSVLGMPMTMPAQLRSRQMQTQAELAMSTKRALDLIIEFRSPPEESDTKRHELNQRKVYEHHSQRLTVLNPERDRLKQLVSNLSEQLESAKMQQGAIEHEAQKISQVLQAIARE